MYFEAKRVISGATRGMKVQAMWHEGAGHVAPDLGTLGT